MQEVQEKKRIVVERKFVFITKEVLELVEKIEAKTAVKKVYKQPRKHSVQEILEDEEDEILEDEDDSSDWKSGSAGGMAR